MHPRFYGIESFIVLIIKVQSVLGISKLRFVSNN